MSASKAVALNSWTTRGAIFALAISIAFIAMFSGFANPSRGQVAPAWEEYSRGEYLNRLKTIFRRYKMALQYVARIHYSGSKELGDVDLFRVSDRDACDQTTPCYYVLFSADLGEIPVITACAFERATLEQNHHPDGTLFYAFQFSCDGSVMQVQISRDHFLVASMKRPGN